MHSSSNPIRRVGPTAALISLILAGTLFVSPGFGQAGADPSFQPIGAYVLVLDGDRDKAASIYHSQKRGTILVSSERLKTIVELNPRNKRLRTFSPMALKPTPTGGLLLDPEAKPTATADFLVDNGLPRFVVEGKQARFENKPPLVGPTNRDGIIEHDPTYGQRASLFKPQGDYLTKIPAMADDVTVKLFFGSWCQNCARFVPRILKVEEELAGKGVQFEYYGLPNDGSDQVANDLAVKTVPTGIFYRNGEEIWRVQGYGWQFPAMAIHNALLGASKKAQ